MREVYIFDIDGCVMPSIFSNFNSKESREYIVKEVIKNGMRVNLYPDFIKFYEKYCAQAESVFFITGRKENEFRKLTEDQLQPLSFINPFQVIYYPEGKSHKSRKYFAWKVKKIRIVIKKTIKDEKLNNTSKENINFYIFDDMNEYFLKIREFKDRYKVNVHLTLIDSENAWNPLF